MSLLMTEENGFRVSSWGAEFIVYGKAEPGGSKTHGKTKTGRVYLRDDNPKAAGWKEQVGIIAGTLMKGRDPFSGPLVLHVKFYRERPKGHFGVKGILRSAPKYPTTKPDSTKLLRPLEDALTGILWRDDAQIVEQHCQKLYGDPARAEVRVMVIP